MSLTRRSFIKKSSYSAAAVTAFGTGVGLAEGDTSTKVVDHITQYEIDDIVLDTQDHPYTAAEKMALETEPSALNYTSPVGGGAPNWMPTPYTPKAGYPTKQTVNASYYHVSETWTTIPSPLIVAYREKLDSGGQGTGIYEAYIPAHTVQKEENWGDFAAD